MYAPETFRMYIKWMKRAYSPLLLETREWPDPLNYTWLFVTMMIVICRQMLSTIAQMNCIFAFDHHWTVKICKAYVVSFQFNMKTNAHLPVMKDIGCSIFSHATIDNSNTHWSLWTATHHCLGQLTVSQIASFKVVDANLYFVFTAANSHNHNNHNCY